MLTIGGFATKSKLLESGVRRDGGDYRACFVDNDQAVREHALPDIGPDLALFRYPCLRMLDQWQARQSQKLSSRVTNCFGSSSASVQYILE